MSEEIKRLRSYLAVREANSQRSLEIGNHIHGFGIFTGEVSLYASDIRSLLNAIEALQAERDAAVLEEREAIADWCYYHTMDTVTRADKAEHAGSYVAGEYHPESGARHSGMGYADAIRARSNKEPRQ